MKKYLSPYDIANNVRMARTLHSGAVLIAEGSTDARVYQRFINPKQCIIIPSNGKDNAIDALKILEKNRVKGVISIVDLDFWKLDGVKLHSSNLFITDTHDLESMILKSKALEKLLSEFGVSSKIKKLSKPIRELLLGGALPIGFFRWVSSQTKDNLYLRFKNEVHP